MEERIAERCQRAALSSLSVPVELQHELADEVRLEHPLRIGDSLELEYAGNVDLERSRRDQAVEFGRRVVTSNRVVRSQLQAARSVRFGCHTLRVRDAPAVAQRRQCV